jgi:hypothetical protein
MFKTCFELHDVFRNESLALNAATLLILIQSPHENTHLVLMLVLLHKVMLDV